MTEAGCDTSVINYIKQYVFLLCRVDVRMARRILFSEIGSACITKWQISLKHPIHGLLVKQVTFSVPLEQRYEERYECNTAMIQSHICYTQISDQLQSSGVSNKFESLISSVKNMLPLRKDLPVTTIMETLMEPGHPESEDYLYFDPKVSKAAAAKVNKTKLQFSDGIVFMIGGGNYLEYQNLMEFAVVSSYLVTWNAPNLTFIGKTEKQYAKETHHLWLNRAAHSQSLFRAARETGKD